MDWKAEIARSQLFHFWRGLREKLFEEGLMAPIGTQNPYKPTSFGANHWQRGYDSKGSDYDTQEGEQLRQG